MDSDSARAESDRPSQFDDLRRTSGVILAPIAFTATFLLTADYLTPAGRSLAAIMSAVCVLWITEAIPLAATALLAVLCILLGVGSAKEVLARFADPIVFLFIGSFMLARAMSLYGLDRRIALSFLSISWIIARPARMLGGLGLVTAVISMWVSNTATTAMMLPIALGILGAVHKVRITSEPTASAARDLRQWPFATGMMLMIAYAASIGGIGTPVGSPPNLITIGLIQESLDIEISFFQWMLLCVPLLTVMAIALFALLAVLHSNEGLTHRTNADATPRDEAATQSMAQYIADERAALGRWTPGQINSLIAFIVAIVLWTLPGFLSLFLQRSAPLLAFFENNLPEAVVALLAAMLLFVLPTSFRPLQFTLNWSQAVQIDWGTILLFGGGLSLGTLMFETGVARALADGITGWTGANSLWSLTAAAIALGIIVSEATSNTAAANMIVPVAIALAQAAGVSPLPPALGACLGASYGFMLPVSTPPNAIVYGSGLVPITKMMRAGIIFDLVGFVIILGGLRVLCPLLGMM